MNNSFVLFEWNAYLFDLYILPLLYMITQKDFRIGLISTPVRH